MDLSFESSNSPTGIDAWVNSSDKQSIPHRKIEYR